VPEELPRHFNQRRPRRRLPAARPSPTADPRRGRGTSGCARPRSRRSGQSPACGRPSRASGERCSGGAHRGRAHPAQLRTTSPAVPAGRRAADSQRPQPRRSGRDSRVVDDSQPARHGLGTRPRTPRHPGSDEPRARRGAQGAGLPGTTVRDRRRVPGHRAAAGRPAGYSPEPCLEGAAVIAADRAIRVSATVAVLGVAGIAADIS
jgi:hypothetical protein